METFRTFPHFSNQTGSHTAKLLWLVALLLVALGGSLAPCLMPFAALAVALVATVRLRTAVVAIVGMWLINQAIGFGVFHFPHTADTFAWGLALGVAAVGATLAGATILRSLRLPAKPARVVVAFVAAFTVYELVLLTATPWLGGLSTFAPAIVGKIAWENGLWLVGLVLANELLSLAVRPWLGVAPLIARTSP